MTEPQQPKAAPTNNQNSLDDFGQTVEHIIDDLIQYEFNNPHHQPKTMVELRERAIVQIVNSAKAAINKTIMEARIEELERLKVMLAGFTWGPYDPFNIINTRITELTKKYGRADNE